MTRIAAIAILARRASLVRRTALAIVAGLMLGLGAANPSEAEAVTFHVQVFDYAGHGLCGDSLCNPCKVIIACWGCCNCGSVGAEDCEH